MIDDKFKTIKDIGIYMLDIAFAGWISSISVSDMAHAFLQAITGITITLTGGSILFILQKTLLPVLTKWMNSKIEKWFNAGTKIEDK
jgi:hypothetical protein